MHENAGNGKSPVIARLNRIEGQVRGVSAMVADGRYCIDILTQVQAIKAALRKVEDELLKKHAAHCVEVAIKDGDAQEQRRKFDELVDLLGRYRA
jgi:CsoR family transcriptional regulator, copper-sensing transcriptional repressor